MFSANGFFGDVMDIPPHWIFQTYLGLGPLTGQTVKIRSIFNSKDKDPSMYIYVEDGKYRFKCFSSGKSGSAVDMIRLYENKSFAEVSLKLKEEYSSFIASGQVPQQIEVINRVTWKVGSYDFRKWTVTDAKFWTAYNIGSDLLGEHVVKPLDYYHMVKTTGNTGQVEQFKNTGNQIYGYFTKSGELYKIYQPNRKNAKYIKVKNHIQGIEQLKGHDYLTLISSLKDMMAMKSLGNLRMDYLAPDSENSWFSKEQIDDWKKDYKAIICMMDADDAGIKSMKYYESTYGIPFCYVPLEKDQSDIVKIHGPDKALRSLAPAMQAAVEKYQG